MRRVTLVAALGVWAWGSGCGPEQANPWAQPPDNPDAPAAKGKNIVAVAHFVDLMPWLTFDRLASPKYQGIKIKALYLLEPDPDKPGATRGVFGDGIIRPILYVEEKDAEGEARLRKVFQWEFPAARGSGSRELGACLRAKIKTQMGWGYYLQLRWRDVNVAGRSVVLVIEYERSDGRVIVGSPIARRVPTT